MNDQDGEMDDEAEEEDDSIDPDDRPELPESAGLMTRSGFEPNNAWLRSASWRLAHEAMRLWFVTRYQDPAENTPYISAEGGYQYIHGGPFSAEDELYQRFSDVVEDPDIYVRRVVDDVESDGITDWAPVHTEPPDYDLAFEFEANRREDAFHFLSIRLREVGTLESSSIEQSSKPLLRQLLFSSLIAALEAYLSDTMQYWVAVEPKVFQNFVRGCEEFQKQRVSLSEIFDKMDGLPDEVEKSLQDLVWHRLDKVKPLMLAALGVKFSDIDQLMKHILVRHDIVHRGGKTKRGEPVIVSPQTLANLRQDISVFVTNIEQQIKKQFPLGAAPGGEI